MAQHKVIGLVSGGKDSCFSLLHCVANGHEIVALATLTPESGTDELDSHLYQSVGTSIPPLIARALEVPHYSRVIEGKAVEQGPEYGDRVRGGQGSGVEGDETEDLYLLLQSVLAQHPDATAIATGAILSTYQRLRIEHVCTRLGLVSLSYLWQAEQMPLLEQMKACGMDVVLVKVAGVGLGREMVGASLWDQLPALRKLERLYGSHPAGEGGEYETLTLDSPLFSHRIRLCDPQTIVSDPEPNLVAYLRIPRAELVEKRGWVRPTVAQLRGILDLPEEGDVRGVMDEAGREMFEDLGPVRKKRRLPSRDNATLSERAMADLRLDARDTQLHDAGTEEAGEDQASFSRNGRWFAVSVSISVHQSIGDVEAQTSQAFLRVQACLESKHLSLLHAAHITLLLPSMSLFPLANKAYAKFFGTSPPSRATVAVPLPNGTGIRVEMIGFDDRPAATLSLSRSSKQDLVLSKDDATEGGSPSCPVPQREKIGRRSALHVQSLSYWAPANIGPYSQAITVNERVQIAGQIPLIPSMLTLPPGPPLPLSPYPAQCALALQHVRKVIEVLRSANSTGGGWTGWVESVTAWWALPLPSGRNAGEGESDDGDDEGGGEAVEVINHAWKIWAEQFGCAEAPLLVLRAKELPRGALVEFQVNLHTGRQSPDSGSGQIPLAESVHAAQDHHSDQSPGGGPSREEDEDDIEDDEEQLEPTYAAGADGEISWESCVTSGNRNRGSRAVIFVSDIKKFENAPSSAVSQDLQRALSNISSRAVSAKIYHLQSIPEDRARAFSYHLLHLDVGVTLVPVYEIHDRLGRSVELACEGFGV